MGASHAPEKDMTARTMRGLGLMTQDSTFRTKTENSVTPTETVSHISTQDATASILSDLELTVYSTTEKPELTTTSTEPRSRETTQDTTASTLSDLELTVYSTTEKPELTTTTTEPRSRETTQDTTASTLSDLELTVYSTTEIPELTTTTTEPRSRETTKDTTASTLSDLELTVYSTTEKPELTTTTTEPRSRVSTQDAAASILSDLELTIYSTTEKPELTTTTTQPRSRASREDAAASILSDLESLIYSTTTEEPELTTETTLSTTEPILRASKQDTIASTGNGLQLENGTAKCAQASAVLCATPDAPSAVAVTLTSPQSELVPPNGTTAEEVPTTTDVSAADFLTGAPHSSIDPTSEGASRNISIIPLGSVHPLFQSKVKPNTTRYRCLQSGLFPSRSSSTEYHWCRRFGNWFLHSKETCPVGQRFSALYRLCVPVSRFKIRPLSYFNNQYGSSRRDLLNDAVIRRIMTKEPRLGQSTNPINLPKHFLSDRHKQYTI
jgi:hypothetical protein